jgi:hypothetical protein
MNRLEHSLDVSQEAVYLQQTIQHISLHHSMTSLCPSSPSHLGHHEHALEVNREAVDLFRQLAAGRPDVFNAGLASSLSSLFAPLAHLGHHSTTRSRPTWRLRRRSRIITQ